LQARLGGNLDLSSKLRRRRRRRRRRRGEREESMP
jgi:hypothetical protein